MMVQIVEESILYDMRRFEHSHFATQASGIEVLYKTNKGIQLQEEEDCDVLCWLSLSLSVISKFDCRILVSLGQFWNFELSNLPIVRVKKFNIADTNHLAKQ
jgi:hypothetical protein